MRACPAGLPVKAHAPVTAGFQHPALAVAPQRGATLNAKLPLAWEIIVNVTETEVPQRKIGALLLVGIILLPIIFVWFLLRPGYSTRTRVLGFGWLAVFVLIASQRGANPPDKAPSLSTSSSPNLTAPEKTPVVSAIEVTSLELGQAYEANEVAAQKRFGDRTLAVSGTVERVTLDFTNDPVIVMTGANQFSGVQASFDKDYADRIAALSKGQKVRVVREKVSEVIASPILSDCSF